MAAKLSLGEAQAPVSIADSGEAVQARVVALAGSDANPRTAFNGAFRADALREPVAFAAQYEIERTAAQLVAGGAHAVGLQFPDELLPDSPTVVDWLRAAIGRAVHRATAAAIASPEAAAASDPAPLPHHAVGLFVLGDTSYGSEFVDEVNAQHLNADAVVHYGRACATRASHVTTIYVFGRAAIAVPLCVAAVRETLTRAKAAVASSSCSSSASLLGNCGDTNGEGAGEGARDALEGADIDGVALLFDPAFGHALETARPMLRRVLDEELGAGSALLWGTSEGVVDGQAVPVRGGTGAARGSGRIGVGGGDGGLCCGGGNGAGGDGCRENNAAFAAVASAATAAAASTAGGCQGGGVGESGETHACAAAPTVPELHTTAPAEPTTASDSGSCGSYASSLDAVNVAVCSTVVGGQTLVFPEVPAAASSEHQHAYDALACMPPRLPHYAILFVGGTGLQLSDVVLHCGRCADEGRPGIHCFLPPPPDSAVEEVVAATTAATAEEAETETATMQRLLARCLHSVRPKDASKMLSKRWHVVQRAREASIFGLLVGTLSVGRYKETLAACRRIVRAAGRRSYTLVVGKPNAAKLANFPLVEVFVLVAGPSAGLLDAEYCPVWGGDGEDGMTGAGVGRSERLCQQPVVTPLELQLALTEAPWTGAWSGHFDTVLAVTSAAEQRALELRGGGSGGGGGGGGGGGSSSEHKDSGGGGGDDDDVGDTVPMYSHVSGTYVSRPGVDRLPNGPGGGAATIAAAGGDALVTATESALSSVLVSPAAAFLQSREYQGLEQAIGETEVHVAAEGLAGIARGYAKEQGVGGGGGTLSKKSSAITARQTTASRAAVASATAAAVAVAAAAPQPAEPHADEEVEGDTTTMVDMFDGITSSDDE